MAPATVAITATAGDTDGTIAKVEFYEGANLLATVTSAPYSYNWTNVAQGPYTLFAKATDDKGATTTSSAVNLTVNANQAPSVSLTAPANNAVYTAPASITLTATASDTDGTVSQVEFLSNGTVVGTATSAPYTFTYSNVAVGGYTLTARATDDKGGQATSSPVTVAVNAASATIYYIHTDQLNTPRAITNEAGTAVWKWDNTDPFGANASNEDADGDGRAFVFNLRFPGQYFDKETNLHYNYFRDYDPQQGRYVESDPIGLRGGSNTYAYVGGNPLVLSDFNGLLACSGYWILQQQTFPQGIPSFPGCICYWMCMPCGGAAAWSGNYLNLPSTRGIPSFNPGVPATSAGRRAGPTKGRSVSRGGDPGGGNQCNCDFPGPEKGCATNSCTRDDPSGSGGQQSRTQ